METGSRVAHAVEKLRESLSRLSINKFKLATNNMLGYDMLRVKLKMICTARFWMDSRWWDWVRVIE